MQPSSVSSGFFQETPLLPNQAHDDISLRRVLRLLLPASTASRLAPDLVQLGDEVLAPRLLAWVTDAERNPPRLAEGDGRDAFGRPSKYADPAGRLVLAEGWKRLQDFGIEKGMVATGYEDRYGPFTRTAQFLRIHLFTGSCANVTCPSAMQDGAARILQLQLGLSPSQGAPEHVEQQRQVLEAAFKRLISRDPRHAWTSGQWMTERSGGSDVSGTETVAVWDPAGGAVENGPNGDPARIPGPWSISGFKWFSSATDAGMAVLLAQVTVPNMSTSSSSSRSLLEEPHGSGLTAFFAPTCLTHRSDPPEPYTLLNGIRIARLKRKLGTVSLPTAELELSGTRAWVLGRVGEGIRTLAPLLAVTRVHSAVAAVGYLGRGLAIARAWARVRKVAAGGGKTRGKRLLMDTPLHVRTLAEMHGEYRGLMLFVFWVCGLMGMAERADSSTSSTPPASTSITLPHPIPLFPASLSTAAKLFRLITPVLKAHVCHATIPLLHSCVEALGGVGYMLNAETEHLNVARLFRDACVLPVWEGTTDVLAVDFMRAATARGEHAGGRGIDAVKALDAWFDCVLDCGAIAGTVGTANGERWKAERDAIRAKWCRTVRDRLLAVAGAPSSVGTEALLADARMVTTALAEAIIAVLLLADAAVVDDDEGAAVVVLRRHLVSRGFLGAADVGVGATSDVATQLDVNRSIIWGSRGAASKL